MNLNTNNIENLKDKETKIKISKEDYNNIILNFDIRDVNIEITL